MNNKLLLTYERYAKDRSLSLTVELFKIIEIADEMPDIITEEDADTVELCKELLRKLRDSYGILSTRKVF